MIGANTEVVRSLLDIMKECTLEELELLTSSIKCLLNMLDLFKNQSESERNIIKEIEGITDELSSQLDLAISQQKGEDSEEEQSSNGVFSLKKLLNYLINNIPASVFACTFSECGRMFNSEAELNNHISRRHAGKKPNPEFKP